MADEITQVSFYRGAVANKAGEGARLLGAIKDAGVNLTGFFGYPKSARVTEVILIVDDKAPNLGPIAKKSGVALEKKQKAFLITGEDRPGLAADVAAKLAAGKVNIVSLHGLGSVAGRFGALLVVDPADNRKIAKLLA